MAEQDIKIKLLGKSYTLSCPPEEVEDLKQAAELLEQKITQLQGSRINQGNEQIALMAALNLCHDLLIEQRRAERLAKSMDSRMKVLQATVERALNERNNSVDKQRQSQNN
ncbi:cell division protein ZapA [Neiella marina]|uniref:Cell division protein ZapA n=1 Tax=Neiella holothuriorum TaxID=2870530 RepID=A0ABS7EKC3_9GAMM|nr:cell division protein ZapA [Neiella holothuriorum]MBW8192680.1 cell division protein ZapA [Neiella holothuriorum]